MEDHSVTQETHVEANAFNRLRFRNGCFTCWDTSEILEWFSDPTTIAGADITYYIAQGEKSQDGKHHIQGYVEFGKQKSGKQVKQIFGVDHIYFYPRYSTSKQASDYCKQQKHGVWHEYVEFGTLSNPGERTDIKSLRDQIVAGSKINNIIRETEASSEIMLICQYGKTLKALEREVQQTNIDQLLIEDYDNVVWRPWQQLAIDEVHKIPDSRLISWYSDPVGDTGKSWLALYLQLTFPGGILYVTGGKLADILYSYEGQSLVVFDLPRANASDMNDLYTAMESIKGGFFLSTKYESCQKRFPKPHVLVFANFLPTFTSDTIMPNRVKIVELSKAPETRLYPNRI